MFAFNIFLWSPVKESIVTKRDVIGKCGAEEIPHCRQWEVS